MSNKKGIKNNICVEVFNKDGSLAQKEEGHNFISINLQDFGKYALRQMLTNKKNYNYSYSMLNILNSADNEIVSNLYCTDSTAAESSTTERNIPGTTVAFVDLDEAFAQTIGTQGTISESDSICDNKQAKFVCEWITDTGNGTFQSVCLGNKSILSVPDMASYEFEKNFKGLAWDGTYWWTSEYATETLLKLDSNFEIVDEIDISADISAIIQDITYYNNYLYIVDNQNIYSFEISTETVTNISTVNATAITNDASHLYAAAGGGFVYKISFSGTIDTTNDTGSENWQAIAYHNSKLYLYDSITFYEYDFSTNTLTNGFGVECNDLYGMTSNSTDIHSIVSYTAKTSTSTQNVRLIGKISNLLNQDMFNRVLLPSSVTKNDTQTMKVTCTITYG